MRLIGRGLLLLIILSLGFWQGKATWNYAASLWATSSTPHRDIIQSARLRTAYALQDQDWTMFAIPASATTLKAITNAHLPTASPLLPEQEWRYSVQYQLLDDAGQILQEHTYHHRTRLTRYIDPITLDVVTTSLYLQDNIRPADSRTMRIHLAQTPTASHLRFRLSTVEPPVQGVALRVFAPDNVPEHKLDYVWRRLNQDGKRALAQGLVYPVELLRHDERRLLLKNRWLILGPQGVKGRDYQSLNLYVMADMEGEPITPPTPPAGRLLDATHRVVIPIPPGGQHLRLEFAPLPPPTVAPRQDGIQLVWYGEKLGARSTSVVPWQGPGTHIEQFFSPGLLELITPTGAVIVRTFQLDGESSADITPELTYLRTYVVQPDADVEFDVVHLEAWPTPFRINARYLTTAADSAESSEHVLNYQLLNTDGDTVKTGQLTFSASLSLYDQVADRNTGFRVSDPVSFYFSLPAVIKRIRLMRPGTGQDGAVVIAAYNRPPDLVRETRVPEDYTNAGLDDDRQRAWFPVHPTDADHLIDAGQFSLLTVQPRPPETNPDLLAGQYQWQAYRPQGAWKARHLLMPHDPAQPLRDEAVAVTYRTIPLGRDVPLRFRNPYGLQAVQPQLVFLRQRREPLSFQVVVDGRLHYQGAVAGRRGEVTLPDIPAGLHQVRLHAPKDGTWLINDVDPGPRPYIKRLA
ncbi:MAG: hypothetical protein OEU26_10375, partial [Candidatus Tectomicrobia bacterium]|nr:hypothetical protein [Candidatus Tectomicrobia bacterium]